VRNYATQSADNLTGSILIATPALKTPQFRKTILFLSYHSPKDGALGFILNRPLQKTAGEMSSLDSTIFSSVPLFYGGPVSPDEVNVASIKWIERPQAVKFQSLNPSESTDLSPGCLQGLRAFAGHSGWYAGQLEAEIARKTWFVLPPNRNLIDMPNPDSAWKEALRKMNPILKFLAEIPDDPSLN
jgi:putative transcriptional regulator